MKKIIATATAIILLSAVTASAKTAEEILEAAGIKGGLIVHIGCGDGKLTAALRANDSYIVHGLDADGEQVAKARGHIQSRGSAARSRSIRSTANAFRTLITW